MKPTSSISMPGASLLESSFNELGWLDDRQEEMICLLIRLCDLNSGTYNLAGLNAVRDLLAKEFACLGGTQNVIDVDPLETIDEQGKLKQIELGKLLHIQQRKPDCPTALLCIHMDTVYPVDSTFQNCNQMPDGRINGPGVADAKGGLVIMLYALQAFNRSTVADKLGWEVIINPDEELGSPGSERFLKQRAEACDFGLLFEPALPNGSLVAARKGGGNFTFVVAGKSVHSGRDFANGRNAIVCCCQLMNEIHGLNNSDDLIFNVGKISGGSALNVVPDLAIGRVNVRVSTREQIPFVEERFSELLDRYNQHEGYSVRMHGRFTSPPKELTSDIRQLQKLVEVCARPLGQDVKWEDTGGACDGNKLAAFGLPNIDTMGPLGGAIHSRDEFVIPASLTTKAKHAAIMLMAAAHSLN